MERMSQDVALSILNTIKVWCYKVISDTPVTAEEREQYKMRIKILNYEEKVIYEMTGDEQIRDVVYDKIKRLYSPEVKAHYAKIRG